MGRPLALAAALLVVTTGVGAHAQPALPDDASPFGEVAIALGDAPVEVSFGSGTIAATIDGAGPFAFGLDTGQSVPLLIPRRLVRELDLPIEGRSLVGDGSGENQQMGDVARIDELRLGPVRFTGVLGLVYDTPADAEEDPVVGALGFPLFAGCLMTLDFEHGLLRLEQGELIDGGRNVEPFRFSQGLPVMSIGVDGHEVPAIIDTGSDAYLMLPSSWLDRLAFTDEPRVIGRVSTFFNTADLVTATLDGSVRLAGHELSEPRLLFSDLVGQANVGQGVLRHFAVTFDQRNRRVRFERLGDEPILAPAPGEYRIGVAFEDVDGELLVARVLSGGAAAAAGLRPGDRIVSLDAAPVEELGVDALGTYFGRPQPVRVVVERRGRRLEFELTPRRD